MSIISAPGILRKHTLHYVLSATHWNVRFSYDLDICTFMYVLYRTKTYVCFSANKSWAEHVFCELFRDIRKAPYISWKWVGTSRLQIRNKEGNTHTVICKLFYQVSQNIGQIYRKSNVSFTCPDIRRLYDIIYDMWILWIYHRYMYYP